MNRLYSRAGAFALSSALCLVSVGRLSAQTTAAPAAKADEETIVLSPFVVEASEDQGYTAKDTLAGTRVRTELKDVASAISVVTAQFLKDTGAKNSADLLIYTPSTEVGGIRGNFSGVAGGGIYQENTISSSTRVRGLDSADNTRDYFLTDIPWDGFNVGRVDLQRGPNSILFGVGSPAGIINTSVNDAAFKTAYNYENRVDQYGSLRNSVSLNQELVKGVLAIRIAAVKDDELYEQKPAFNNSERFYGALRFDPKLFGESNHTSIKVKYEDGKVNSNNPRSIPPGDSITRWFGTAADAYGNPGYNKIVINQFNPAQVTPFGTFAAGKGGNLVNALGLSNQARSYWPDIINYYEVTPKNLNSVPTPANPSSTPLKTITAGVNTGLGFNGFGGAVNSSFLPLGIPMNTAYYPNGNLGTNGIPGGAIPGAIYYANSVLQDPSIFNFYKKLGDGPNKKEWQKWHALNVALEQTFFNDRLAFQLAFDHQDYISGAEQFMAGENYNINVDINATYADGTPNPNVGRPYFGNGASSPGLNFQNSTIRDTIRFTPTYDLHFEDFLGNNKLAKILGHHVFTGVFEHSTVRQDYVNFARYATTPDYVTSNSVNNNAADTLGSNRSFEWIAYIGPSLSSKSSASGANLARINYVIAPPVAQATINYNSTWKVNPIPGTTGYVDPTATAVPTASATPIAGWIPVGGLVNIPATGTTPATTGYNYYNPAGYYAPGHTPADGVATGAAIYSYINPVNGQQVSAAQSQNPANYVGWSQQQVKWMSSDNAADYPSLVQSANRTRFRDISRGFTWQGYFLNGDLVPTVGWRKDVITSYQTNSLKDQFSGFTSLNYDDDLTSRSDIRGESKSWGGVYHLPKSLTSKLPWGTTFSVFYDRSTNFKADSTRLNLDGLPIPNAIGHTKEYGFTLTTLNDKLSLKIDWFKTKVANATLSGTEGNSIGGLGQNGYFLADGSIWGYGWATYLQRGLDGQTTDRVFDYAAADGMPENTPAEIAAADAYNRTGGTFGSHTYVGGNAVINAWLTAPFAPNFFKSFNLSPPLDPSIGAKSGKLSDSYYTAGYPKNNNDVGGGSSFGNHQTTVDNLSQGTEYELSYSPVKNWNLIVNYSRIKATHENIDPVSADFIGRMTKFFNGPGGQLREWGNGSGSTIGAQWNNSIVGPYTVLLNQLGHAAPEVSPWRLNAISNYTFDHGIVKGVFVGGAFRMEAGRIIGYKFDPTFKNVNSTDPNYANVTAVTLGGLNVNQPYIGKNDTHLDAWVGYNRKLTRKVNWRIQLNVKSLGESDKLVAGRVNPDGSIALARIQQGAGYQLTNSFDF